MTEENRCQLLHLPAEIRNSIYQHTLAPTGSVALTSTKSKRYATDPVLAPGLLATCRQINAEASEILYSENTVCITVDAEDTCWPTIAENRLPQRSLEKLQHLFVILDCTAHFFKASFADVDWNPFSALISLKSIRIAILHHLYGYRFAPHLLVPTISELLTQVLERIPADASVTFHIEEGSAEEVYLTTVKERFQRHVSPDVIVQSDAEDCQFGMNRMGMLELEQGSKSGGIEDVYAEYHDQYQRAKVLP